MRRLDALRAGWVGDGARQLEDAVVNMGAESHPPALALAGSAGASVPHGRPEELVARLIHRAVIAHLSGTYVRVRGM